MAESIETRTTRFDGLSAKVDGVEPVLQKILDKLSAMEQRQAKADESVAAALNKTDDTTRRLQQLDLQSPPSTQQHHPRPPPVWVNPFDLNTAPGYAGRPSASASERPNGHHQDNGNRDVGGGILGSHPPLPVTGPFPRTTDLQLGSSHTVVSHSHKPNMNFPTFDGTNPRLWKDKCESYFEIYNVNDALKPRFAALNFSGVA
jgi:hypothetical protein